MSGIIAEECSRLLRIHIYPQMIYPAIRVERIMYLPIVIRALFLQGDLLAAAWWGTRLWVRELHPAFVHEKAWRRVASFEQQLP